jgi:hypothetical protein
VQRLALPLLLLALAACASGPTRPVSLVGKPLYQAVGGPPGWVLAVSPTRIVLRLAAEQPRGPALVLEYEAPRSSYAGGVKLWDAGTVSRQIRVEARRGPCRRGATRFQDEVRVRYGDRELNGCGGRIAPEGRD